MAHFLMLQCSDPGCLFRYPLPVALNGEQACPRCGKPVHPAEATTESPKVHTSYPGPSGPEIEVLLDNIRSAWNVGSMLRSADGAGVRHVHICGMSTTPENPKTSKTSLGAERAIRWSYHPNGLEEALNLKAQGMRLWALEGGELAVSIFDAIRGVDAQPIALAIGNELTGVDPGILRECEQVVAIPMQGYKRSLNVAIAFGIAIYLLRFGTGG